MHTQWMHRSLVCALISLAFIDVRGGTKLKNRVDMLDPKGAPTNHCSIINMYTRLKLSGIFSHRDQSYEYLPTVSAK